MWRVRSPRPAIGGEHSSEAPNWGEAEASRGRTSGAYWQLERPCNRHKLVEVDPQPGSFLPKPFTPTQRPCRTDYRTWPGSQGKKASRKAALSMRGTRQKSAVLLDKHPLWLDAMEKLVGREGI